MEHVAIMRKSWGLTQKILSGQKKIESRWYKVKYSPWDRIKSGEIVYFKDSGKPVTIKTEVEKVIQFSDLTPEKVKEILYQYGQADGLGIDKIPEFFEMFKNKKYCMLIFLKNPLKIEPFEIDKSGFGAMSAWISVDDVNRIKANP
ncbi:MAG: ASCH domain-containing protein [Candidatus Aenigmarchaeota archaeon]|nr:ASCH domain-containing protein [Candidatus Aenigmarchaeota archaeon]